MASPTRATLLDHATRILLEDGYAAVSYRSLAARARVGSSLVQYYFPSLDDLFVALLRRNTEQFLRRIDPEVVDRRPLRTIWEHARSRSGTTLLLEFMALAHHRGAVHREMERGTERIRQAQLAAVTGAWERYGLGESPFSPASLLFVVNALPRMMLLEQTFGTHTGHSETIELIEQFLDRVEPHESGPDDR